MNGCINYIYFNFYNNVMISLLCYKQTHLYLHVHVIICVNSRKILLVDILNILHVKKMLRYPMSWNFKFVGF